ncbi:MAG: polysaccharide biosynthesis/export family protein, partial [Smithellaceae bacterium]|nr:polysaccharide biosynthesis/export family protein [Smithellaceae bacterium]
MKNKRQINITFLKRLSIIILLVMFCCATDAAVAQTLWESLTVEQKAELLKKMPPEEMNYIQNELMKSPASQTAETSWESLTRQQKSNMMNKLSPEEQQFLKNKLNKPSSPQSFTESLTRQQQIEMMKKLTPEERRLLENELKRTPEALSSEEQLLIENEMKRSPKALTPEALDALKKSPEFRGLMAEDVIRGREMLDEKGTPFSWEPEQSKKSGRKPDVKRFGETDFRERPDEKEAPTLFQRTRKIGKYQDISLDLKPFGYEFFKDTSIRLITDRKDIPVPANYIVGPGDQVKILFWGRVNAQYSLTIDRNGSITIPEIGPIYVAGMTFEQMSTRLIKQSKQIVGANIDVTMGSLKTMPIFVTGDVARPGAYMIGSFAKITDALLIAGGPSEIGSMRNVQLKRKNKIVATFDLYDFLLKGDKANDTVLQADDVVFVPVSGPQVGVAGNVKRPAIYELKDKT